MQTRKGAAICALSWSCLAAAGCDDHEQFTTRPGESYCGAVTVAAVFRTGLSPRVQMRLTLDANALDEESGAAGTLSTFEASDPTVGTPERRMLANAPLRPIAAIQHDPLSRPEFGDGRERNAIFAVSPAASDAESLLAIVSLKSDDSVEVRLLRAGAPEDPSVPEGKRQIFGLFPLERQNGQCGF